jgi:hypothetical protein
VHHHPRIEFEQRGDDGPAYDPRIKDRQLAQPARFSAQVPPG